ncbi:transglutaminaseTgpA domain-containing protein [Aliagarivorans marinus]|uniref:transglutaminase family protein n=1 Tax=Aliagarivorans marinus TaxID=561965 RepID=UPI00047EBE11|nr:DUF3488 and transglutaminase-like domain-containing protein [Aliagarivorans marinus]
MSPFKPTPQTRDQHKAILTYLPLGKAQSLLFLQCFFATSLLLWSVAPLWLLATGGVLGLWRWRLSQGRAPDCSRWLKLLITLAMALLTIASSWQQGQFEIAVNVVLLGYCLKLIELRQRRDLQAFVLCGWILAALALLLNVAIIYAVLACISLLLHLLLLLSIDVPLSLPLLRRLALWSGSALPLTAVLFVVLPRLGPLWQMPTLQSATTGLSEQVRPGDISQLIRSDRLAFRATFDTPQSSLQQFYWRALVLDQFDGESWSRSTHAKLLRTSGEISWTAGGVPYSIIYQPSDGVWAPSLWPSVVSQGALRLTRDNSWQRRANINQRSQASFVWLSDAPDETLAPSLLRRLSTLPANTEQRILSLAEQFAAAPQPLAAMRDWFLQAPFGYTLNPPVYPGSQGLGDFLFEGQLGFCVHYAQAVVVLARSMGYPARMVAGYLGGEWNTQRTVITVRDYDAHAWAEIWVEGKWQQIDPTGWIAPKRVQLGLQQSAELATQWRALSPLGSRLWYSQQLLALRSLLERADYLWAQWVVNFDSNRQNRLLDELQRRFSLDSLLALSLGLLSTAGALTLLLFVRPWQWRVPDLPLLRLRMQLSYWRLRGRQRAPNETLKQFCQRLRTETPRATRRLELAVDAYYRSRYHSNT